MHGGGRGRKKVSGIIMANLMAGRGGGGGGGKEDGFFLTCSGGDGNISCNTSGCKIKGRGATRMFFFRDATASAITRWEEEVNKMREKTFLSLAERCHRCKKKRAP